MKSGDFVWIKKLGQHKSHFNQECVGILEKTYFEQYSGGDHNRNQWGVYLQKYDFKSACSWYDSDEIIVIITYEI